MRATSARPAAAHRFHAAADAHAGAGEHPQEGHVREAVPRGPAAGGARRDQRRRPLRRHPGHVQRRARRQAVQHVRLVGVAVPHAVVLVHEPVAAAAVRGAGLLADAVLLRLRSGRCSTAPSTRYVNRDQAIATQTARGATIFGIYPLNRYTRVELSARHLQLRPELQRPAAAGRRQSVPAGSVRTPAVLVRHLHAVRRSHRARDHGVP